MNEPHEQEGRTRPRGARCSRRKREWLVHAGESTKGTGHRAQDTGVDPSIRGPDLLRGARCNHDGVLGCLGRWLRINWRWRRSSMVVSSLQEPVRRAGQRAEGQRGRGRS
jgi:hypothetical protein